VDALDVLKVCLRRWYVLIPVVLLSLAAGLGLAQQQKPTYTAFGSYALVYHSPQTTSQRRDPLAANPLAGNGAVLLGEALAADFMSSGSQATFGGVGHSGTAPREAVDGSSYSVSLPEGSQSYLVQTWGKDPDGLRTVVDSVLAAAPERAAQIQDRAGAPERSQYTTFVTGSTQLTKLPPTSRLKLIIAMLGVGILAGSALSLVIDRLGRSRKNRRAAVIRQVTERHAVQAAKAGESPQILTVPVLSETEGAPAISADDNAQLDDGAGIAGATAPEDAVEGVHADGNDVLSLEQVDIDEVPVAWAEELWEDQAEEVPADQAEEVPADQAEEVSADHAWDLAADDTEELPAVQPEYVSADEVTEPSSAEEATKLPTERAEQVSPRQVEHVPTEQAEGASLGQAEDLPVDHPYEVPAAQAEDMPAEHDDHEVSEGTEAESHVNHADVDDDHELDTRPLPEYTPAEPDFADGWNDESSPDDGLWPLLEHDQEFEREDATDNRARDWQPTH
jgi:hypothetical protein